MSVTIPTFQIEFNGPIIMIGFGSIGKATLPLLRRHIKQGNDDGITVISPDRSNESVALKYKANFINEAITSDNYKLVLNSILKDTTERSLIINVANEVSSKSLIEFASENNSHYIDTVIEPWPGFYLNDKLSLAEISNYSLREDLLKIKSELTNTPTAISCCGANPGMVSWLVKEALVNLAKENEVDFIPPTNKKGWAKLMSEVGVKGIHIAEKDTQYSNIERKPGTFINTWSVEGCLAECLQPAELGWGTHESELPSDGRRHKSGSGSAIYLEKMGGNTRVQTWTPSHGPHFGFLITHNEAISISDYFSLKDSDGNVLYRPTCHYAYHPSEAAVESLSELFNERNSVPQEHHLLLKEEEIVSGHDELGVLLYGHEKGAYWYGSKLTIEEARELAPHQNATGLQVSSAILAGIFYALNHPNEGLLETDEMEYRECLKIQKPYLGKVAGYFTDWVPNRSLNSNDNSDRWQFSNIRIN
jgi:homospermidine synthase